MGRVAFDRRRRRAGRESGGPLARSFRRPRGAAEAWHSEFTSRGTSSSCRTACSRRAMCSRRACAVGVGSGAVECERTNGGRVEPNGARLGAPRRDGARMHDDDTRAALVSSASRRRRTGDQRREESRSPTNAHEGRASGIRCGTRIVGGWDGGGRDTLRCRVRGGSEARSDGGAGDAVTWVRCAARSSQRSAQNGCRTCTVVRTARSAPALGPHTVRT